MKTICSFDLGKAFIGEAVRDAKTNKLLHQATVGIHADGVVPGENGHPSAKNRNPKKPHSP